MEMSGSRQALLQLINSMSNGGRIALIGIQNRNMTEVPINTIIWNGLKIKGIYGREMFETWYKMAAMIKGGFDLKPIITHRFDVRDYEEGFAAMNSGNSGKVILDWTKI